MQDGVFLRGGEFDEGVGGGAGTAALPKALPALEAPGWQIEEVGEGAAFKKGDRVALLGIGSGLNCMMLGVDW